MNDLSQIVLAKALKNVKASDLAPGLYEIHETVIVHIDGVVEKLADESITPTVSIPMIATLALMVEKCGITRDAAIRMMREAMTEALELGSDKDGKDAAIHARIKDVEAATKLVKQDLLASLPKVPRDGKLLTKDIKVKMVGQTDDRTVSVEYVL